MKRFSLWHMGALAGFLALMIPLASFADEYDKKTIITISQPTEAPGIVLEPGTYVIKLLNSSSNRHIVEIMNERMNHLYALSFAAAAERVEPAGKTILTFYEASNGRPPALRKWFWPGDTIGQEFIYPKNQAERIAAATKQKVPEGNLPTVAESGQKLVPDNERNEVSKEAPAPLAARAAEPPANPEPAPPVIAQNTPPPQPQAQPQPAPPAAPENPQPSSTVPSSTPQEQNLPQTASPLPLIGLAGVVLLGLGASLGFVRRSRSVRG